MGLAAASLCAMVDPGHCGVSDCTGSHPIRKPYQCEELQKAAVPEIMDSVPAPPKAKETHKKRRNGWGFFLNPLPLPSLPLPSKMGPHENLVQLLAVFPGCSSSTLWGQAEPFALIFSKNCLSLPLPQTLRGWGPAVVGPWPAWSSVAGALGTGSPVE